MLTLKTIEMHHSMIEEAIPGDNCGFVLRGIEKKDIARGDVVGRVDNPPTLASEFTAQIVVLNHPSVFLHFFKPFE